MVNVRRGINIRTSFAMQQNGIAEDLSQAQNLRVVIRHKCQPNSAAAFTGSAVKVEGNLVSVVVTDIMQKTMTSGGYLIEVAYRLNNPSAPEGYDPYIIDSDVFTLTDRSADVGGVSCGDVTVQVVNLTGEVSFCSQALEQLIDEAIAAVQAANEAAQNANDAADAAMAIVDSKVDIDGLNANVKRLQFDTTNPTAPMQIGQIAWDNDEHTLVTHDGLHTHPLGKELELRARNTSGATILNGRACYVTGSTGDNPTIALATNTNGDVAQKTIGVATMDIANNAFGIVTTFGEVNDIDTSALTLGAIVYLGANGQLTTTEPVAPTPKTVIGLCVRQHARVGKLFVSTRPIARLSKLSEVHAPALTDNDVLRYNGTTLRWEVYSLAGKADLVGGKVPSAQLPAYVDDVLEYATLAAFPATGESGKIYVALNTNLTYRWSGTAYVEISKSLALGETADTAYRGDRGKTAYDHSQTTGNPHGTTAAQVSNTPAGSVAATTVQGAINELAGDIVQVETDLNYMYPSVGIAKRVLADAGTIKSRSTLNDLANKFLDLLPNTKLLFCPHLAVKLRESGIYKYVTKLYDVGPAMWDGAQTTALNQPYLSGNVAPNEKYALKNPNGGNAYLTHAPISFDVGDKWSVTVMLNFYGSNNNDAAILINTANTSFIAVRRSGYNYIAYGDSDGNRSTTSTTNQIIGKTTLLTFSHNGDNLSFYLNGKLYNVFASNLTSKMLFDSLIGKMDLYRLYGTIHFHAIRDIALSPTQVQEEYTYLRSIFPEIESVQIGTQTWATSNCEMTCTPQGNVIAEMQAAANVEKITNVADREFSSDTGWWNKVGDVLISDGVCNIKSDGGSSTYINKSILTVGKQYKLTYTIVRNAIGTLAIEGLGDINLFNINSSVGTHTYYLAGVKQNFVLKRAISCDIDIDNVSVEEIGWSDSTNLYNYVYANTTGTAEQKEYAAVKAAAMWRNVNNDPVLASVFGKKFNKYAKRLLAMDIAYYNAANPTALWGWDIPTQAQLTTLASNGGNALKVGGTNYWNTSNGINSTGLTLLGGGYIDANGNYVGNKTHEGVWAKDADIARVALDADNSFNELAATTEGYSIRLIKV